MSDPLGELGQAGWETVATLDELGDGGLLLSMLGDEEIVLCRVGHEVFALSNWCTHADARLCEGSLAGFELECPLHQGKFDVRSGKGLCDPVDTDVRTFPVRIVGTKIHVFNKT
jgi:naphthalene 1,2-dioxygenase system ferredoxin subunit